MSPLKQVSGYCSVNSTEWIIQEVDISLVVHSPSKVHSCLLTPTQSHTPFSNQSQVAMNQPKDVLCEIHYRQLFRQPEVSQLGEGGIRYQLDYSLPYPEHRPEQRHHTSPSGMADHRVCSPSLCLRTSMALGRHMTPSHPPSTHPLHRFQLSQQALQ